MYTDRKSAPLGWMKFYQIVIIPLNILIAISHLLTFIGVKLRFFYTICIVFDLAVIAVAVIGEIGLMKWKRSGPLCVSILQWTSVAGSIIALFFIDGFGGYQILRVFVTIGLCFAWTAYFLNRAPLFSPDYHDPQPEIEGDQMPETEGTSKVS